MARLAFLLLALLCLYLGLRHPAPQALQASTVPAAALPEGWWKGNTHTHTLWSDGNAAPEKVAAWYRSHGYHFLVLSDHNILSEGEKWFPVSDEPGSRLTSERVEELARMFGKESVVERHRDGQREMRLQTLAELRRRFEAPGEFLFIQGEEITDSFEGRPVHVNGLHLVEVVPPQGGTSVRDVLQRNIDAVLEQGRRFNRPVLAHVNHPNFGWGLTAGDVASITGERFFEVLNGHSAVRNYGDAAHPSTERMWDIALTLRLEDPGLGLLYGLATDDSHEYFTFGVGKTNPGRGWVLVKARELSARAILRALRQGDFYASSGVTLRGFDHDSRRFRVEIAAEEGLAYMTRFLGTRRVADGTGPVGELLAETAENPAVYEFQGDELYVRAKVISSRLHPNPYAEGDHECAWIQPVVPVPAARAARPVHEGGR